MYLIFSYRVHLEDFCSRSDTALALVRCEVAPGLWSVTVIQCLLLLMGNCLTYLWEIVSPTYGNCFKTSSDAHQSFQRCELVFSNLRNLVTIDLLSELYLMVPLLLLVTNSNRLTFATGSPRPEPEPFFTARPRGVQLYCQL